MEIAYARRLSRHMTNYARDPACSCFSTPCHCLGSPFTPQRHDVMQMSGDGKMKKEGDTTSEYWHLYRGKGFQSRDTYIHTYIQKSLASGTWFRSSVLFVWHDSWLTFQRRFTCLSVYLLSYACSRVRSNVRGSLGEKIIPNLKTKKTKKKNKKQNV